MSTLPSTAYNPFGWRLAELADQNTDDLRRRDLIESLIVAEAEEIALGRRHLTIVHGAPQSFADSEALDDFYDRLFVLVDSAEWSRIRGKDEFVTVTLGGARADEGLLDVVEMAHQANPGTWKILERPYPNVE